MDLSNDTLATVLIMISAVMHAVVNSLIRGKGGDVLGRSVVSGVAGMVILPAAFILPLPTPQTWGYLGVTILVHAFYQHCLINMYRRADLTIVYPIARGLGPAGVAVWSWGALQLWPGWGPFTGVAMICIGIFAMAWVGLSQRRSQIVHVPLSAFAFAVGTGAGIATYTLIDAAGVRASPSAYTYIVWMFVLHGVMMLTYGLAMDRKATMAAFLNPPRNGIIAGLSSVLTYGLALMALRIGNTAELAALRETSIVFALIIGAIFLKETVGPGRIAAALLIAVGAIVIKTG